ncbi:hypothetical protein Hypma_004246 [Hypsizygus marmoreus]|uniref:Uncharacterized protein n=1 Tax=Hypsizygus marmoreus TaxID=39966 RepID=A0A369J2C3_HYPMA|nr:hypothetical protein Hypma_004246 [Hypsizygus marmoreus]
MLEIRSNLRTWGNPGHHLFIHCCDLSRELYFTFISQPGPRTPSSCRINTVISSPIHIHPPFASPYSSCPCMHRISTADLMNEHLESR